MGGAALVAVFLSAAPIKHVDVKVKSKHDIVAAEAGGAEYFKVRTAETLRGAAIGPGSVRLSFRSLAAPGAKPVSVTVTCDGREVALLSLAGKGVQALEGESALASAPVERILEIPSGPHTLFVEVGPGVGHVLVAFDEPASSAAAADARAPAGAGAAGPAGAPVPSPAPTSAGGARANAATQRNPAKLAAARPPAGDRAASVAAKQKSPGPLAPGEPAAAGSKGIPPSRIAREDARSAKGGGRPAEPRQAGARGEAAGPRAADGPELASAILGANTGNRVSNVEPLGSAGAGSASVGEPPPLHPRHFHLGVRAGCAGQAQLGALGPAFGASVRFQLHGRNAAEAPAGLVIGLSADYLRYHFALDLGSDRGQAMRMQDLVLANVPILAEALWSFGPLTRWRLIPSLGGTAGVSLSTASGQGSVGRIHQTEARPAVGAVAGLELPFGAGRLGAEARYLHSTTGSTGAAQNFQVGGALFQASWRFGL